MTINNINVKDTVDQARLLLEQEQNISAATKAIFSLLLTLMYLMLEELSLSRQRRFGNKSEAIPGEPILSDDNSQIIPVTAHTRKKNVKTRGRNIDTSTLPRYKMYHDLSTDEQSCGCCHNILEPIGQDVCEQLEVVPMLLYVVEHIRYKYACRKCQTLIMAPKPPAPLPKALAGGSLLSEVIISKYQYHLPLYRQSKIFVSLNADIPDNTLGNWVMQAGAQLMSVLEEPMWQAALATNYLQVDESPVKVQKPNQKGYLWTYFAPLIGNGLVMFEFSLTRSGDVAAQRLTNYKGLMQTDGYGGYNKLRQRKNITGFGCLTHARRKYSEVLKITNNSTGVAFEFIERIKPLYALEAKMRALNYSFHTKKRLRQKQAWPILKALLPWLKQQLPKIPPKSKLAQAVTYTLNQWQYIIAYLRHGIAEIDTNWVENEIRPSAIGKKNWLFINNEDSGAVSAFWYSLVQSALLNNLNPRTYIHFLLMNVHKFRRKEIEPATLLPHIIDKEQLQKFENEQRNHARHLFDSV